MTAATAAHVTATAADVSTAATAAHVSAALGEAGTRGCNEQRQSGRASQES
jgi:hypothetical protein